MIFGVVFPVPLRPKEIPVVVLLLFFLVIIFAGIWFLAKYLVSQGVVSPNSFPIILLVLTILASILYTIGFVKIIIHIRKK